MRFTRRTSRRRIRRSPSPRLQHSPATIGSAPTANTGTLVLITAPNTNAGSSATSARQDNQDRDRTVAVGHRVGKITINLAFRGIGVSGYSEVVVGCARRQQATPAKATAPFPSDATCASVGSQQAYRMDQPGWVYRFSQIPLTTETTTVKTITVSPSKFKADTIRDGDYWYCWVFNRTGGNITFDIQMRYYTYS